MSKKKVVIKTEIKTPVALDLLAKAKLFEEKDKEYSDNYLRAGAVLEHLFPNGLKLNDEEAFNRFALFNQMLNKMMRYAGNFDRGGHADSLDDLAIYAMMQKESDQKFKDEVMIIKGVKI